MGENFSINLGIKGKHKYVSTCHNRKHMLIYFIIKCENFSNSFNCSLDILQLSLKGTENGPQIKLVVGEPP